VSSRSGGRIDVELAGEIERYLLDAAEQLFPFAHEVTRETRLDYLGFDSLDLVELVTAIEDRFDVERRFRAGPLADLVASATVGDLIDALAWEDDVQLTPRAVEPSASESLQGLLNRGRLRWRGSKPTLPTAVRLSGTGQSAAEYIAEGRR